MTARLSGLALCLVLVGCAEDGGGPSVTTPPSATSEHPAVSPLGAPVALAAADGREVSVTVESVDVTATCPGRSEPTLRAELGYFVVLDVTVRVAETPMTAATADALPISAEDFAVVDADGTRQPISSTPTSWACFEDPELLEPFVAVGVSAQGNVVLDSRTSHGVAVLELPGVGTAAWTF